MRFCGGDEAEFAQVAGNGEAGGVAFAFLVFDAVFGQGEAACLQCFLQHGFGIFAFVIEADAADPAGKQVADDLFGSVEIRVEADGGKHGFHGVGEDGRPSETAAFEFAVAQQQGIADFEFRCDFGQCVLIDEVGAQAGQAAFGQVGEGVVEHFGYGVVQDGVADKFEAFVMAGGVAAVREGAGQQFGLFESVLQFLLDVLQCGGMQFRVHFGIRREARMLFHTRQEYGKGLGRFAASEAV